MGQVLPPLAAVADDRNGATLPFGLKPPTGRTSPKAVNRRRLELALAAERLPVRNDRLQVRCHLCAMSRRP